MTVLPTKYVCSGSADAGLQLLYMCMQSRMYTPVYYICWKLLGNFMYTNMYMYMYMYNTMIVHVLKELLPEVHVHIHVQVYMSGRALQLICCDEMLVLI